MPFKILFYYSRAPGLEKVVLKVARVNRLMPEVLVWATENPLAPVIIL